MALTRRTRAQRRAGVGAGRLWAGPRVRRRSGAGGGRDRRRGGCAAAGTAHGGEARPCGGQRWRELALMRNRRTMCSATVKLRRPPHAVPSTTGAFRAGWYADIFYFVAMRDADHFARACPVAIPAGRMRQKAQRCSSQ
jgi:hypothetical protein